MPAPEAFSRGLPLRLEATKESRAGQKFPAIRTTANLGYKNRNAFARIDDMPLTRQDPTELRAAGANPAFEPLARNVPNADPFAPSQSKARRTKREIPTSKD